MNSQVFKRSRLRGSKMAVTMAVVAIVTLLVFSMVSGAIDYSQTYKYTGSGTAGYGQAYRFSMTEGWYAFCGDYSVYINTSSNYVKVPLDEPNLASICNITNPDKIRAILNYSWNHTSKEDITAVQYALWHFITFSGSTPPTLTSSSVGSSHYDAVKAIYDMLLDDAQTPPITAAEASTVNTFTLVGPLSGSWALTGGVTQYTFDFSATSSTGAAIVFDVLGSGGTSLDASKYEIVDMGSGDYQLILKGVTSPTSFTLKATTLKNKSTDAEVFVTYDNKRGTYSLNREHSQTVIGILLSQTTQSEIFGLSCTDPTPTPTPSNTPTPTPSNTPTPTPSNTPTPTPSNTPTPTPSNTPTPTPSNTPTPTPSNTPTPTPSNTPTPTPSNTPTPTPSDTPTPTPSVTPTPTPSDTPTPTPSNTPTPTPEISIPQDTPPLTTITSEATVTEPPLPKTGGVDTNLLYLLGSALVAGGLMLKRRRNDR